MPRKNKTDRELGWLRNVWEELASAEMRHGGFASITIRPTATRSVFTVRIELVRPEAAGGLSGFEYHTMVRYPTGDNTEFLAWLWGRCDRFVNEIALADGREQARQALEG